MSCPVMRLTLRAWLVRMFLERALKVELVLTGYALFDKLKLDRFRFVWFRLQAGQFVLFEAFTAGFRLELCRSGLRFDRLGFCEVWSFTGLGFF